MKTSKLYIGLNENFHDPAICIMDADGNVLFAEATERYLQYKGGLGCPVDPDLFVEKIFESIDLSQVEEVKLAYSWKKSRHFTSNLFKILGLFQFHNSSIFKRILTSLGAHYSFIILPIAFQHL
jgi:predicted NodU family carbamoyl transferase